MKHSLTKTLFAGTVAGLLTACNGGSGFQPVSPGAPNTMSTAGHRTGGKGYQFTVLGTLGGTFGVANSINNAPGPQASRRSRAMRRSTPPFGSAAAGPRISARSAVRTAASSFL